VLSETLVQDRVLQFVGPPKHDTRVEVGKPVGAQLVNGVFSCHRVIVGCVVVSTVNRALLRLLMVFEIMSDRVRSAELALCTSTGSVRDAMPQFLKPLAVRVPFIIRAFVLFEFIFILIRARASV
jgi:hypothetical protein